MPAKKTAGRSSPAKTSRARVGKRGDTGEAINAGREVSGVVIVCLGLLSSYFVLSGDATGFSGVVRSVMLGMAGNLCYLLPVIICWTGILVAFSARRGKANPSHIALIAGLFLILFGFVELFFVEDLLAGLRVHTYVNFLAEAAKAQKGAGLLGALTAWPLYRALGLRVWGSSILYIALAVVDLILMRKISLSHIRERAETRFADYHQRMEARREERIERRDARAARLNADRYAREQLVIPKAEPRGAKARGEDARAEAQDAFEQSPAAPKAVAKVPKIEKIAEPLQDRVEMPNAAESGVDAEPDVFRSLRERKRAGKGAARRAEPEAMPPFDPGELLGGAQIPHEKAAEPLAAQEAEARVPTSDGIDMIQTEVLDTEEENDEIIPGNPLVEEYVPRRVPAQPLPSFSEERTIDLSSRGETAAEDPPFDVEPVSRKETAAEPSRRAGETGSAPAPAFEPPVYNYPPVDLLETAKPSKVRNLEQMDAEKAKKLVEILLSFGITTRLTGISHGPTVTRFELAPASGVKVSRITSLVDDIALGLAARSIRMEAPIPGKAAIGVEVPNDEVETVPLREVLESAEAQKHPSRLAAAMGRDNAGHNVICDLAKMPHILIAGATGSGKSVCINCIICSILYRATPEEVRLILVDPKMVELSVYNGIPHLLIPVVTDPKKAAGALEWAVNEMTQRYKKFSDVGAKDIKGYNMRRPEDEPAMPQIVIIIDELADLMMVAPGDVEDAICRIAQLARAAGIHLVVATQRPSVNVITGVIKANIPSRVAFTVASQVDSRTILDVGGAEKLLMRGDMLYAPSGTNKPTRVQGCWVSENEVQAIVDYIRARHDAEYDDSLKEHLEKADMSDEEKEEADDRYDDLLPQAIEFVVEAGQASISMLQRKMRIGYARAGRLIDEMARRGYIGEADGAKPREVLMTREQFRAQYKD